MIFARVGASVASGSRWLESKVVDADTFRELLEILATEWDGLDQGAKQKREEAAKALLHAEQRNLLAQKLAQDFEQGCQRENVPAFVSETENLRRC